MKSFSNGNIYSVLKILSPAAFMRMLDLRDTYHHVPIYASHQQYLRFAVQIGESHWQFRALPFGLVSAPSIFKKILAEPVAYLGKQEGFVIPYVGDVLNFGPSIEGARNSLALVIALLERGVIYQSAVAHVFGLQSRLFPSNTLSSCRKYALTQEHLVARVVSLRDMVKLLGLMSSCIPSLGLGSLSHASFPIVPSLQMEWEKRSP